MWFFFLVAAPTLPGKFNQTDQSLAPPPHAASASFWRTLTRSLGKCLDPSAHPSVFWRTHPRTHQFFGGPIRAPVRKRWRTHRAPVRKRWRTHRAPVRKRWREGFTLPQNVWREVLAGRFGSLETFFCGKFWREVLAGSLAASKSFGGKFHAASKKRNQICFMSSLVITWQICPRVHDSK